MIALETDTHRKLIASLRLLESDKEGERQAALSAVRRLLPPGVTLADVVEGGLGKPWRAKARAVWNNHLLLSAKEISFVGNLLRARLEPSAKQLKWLDDLAERVEAGL